jgi:hypothetical protein
VKYLSYYAKQYALNPAYINVSLVDTFWAFCCNFIINYDNLQFFRYIPWNENEVNSTLINEYEWETAPDTTTTWRIGDGTASFYNYVYMAVAGLTEHDTFRSNQIREGSLTRKEALAIIPEDNWPRYEGIEWYANTIGFDCNEAINVVNEMPKRYSY